MTNRVSRLLILSLLIVAATSVLATAGPVEPIRQLTVRNYDVGTSARRALWENGRLLSIASDSPEFFSLNASGDLAVQATIPNGVQVMMSAAASSRNGQSAIAGTLGTSGTGAAFIGWIDSTGAFTQVTSTGGFRISAMAFANDGTLWVAGTEYDVETQRPLESFDVLRHYDAFGNFIAAALPLNSSFFSMAPDDTGLLHYPAENSYLAASGERMGFYSSTVKGWVELCPPLDTVSSHWIGAFPAKELDVTGLAFTDRGDVFISANVPSGDTDQKLKRTYKLNRDTAVWEPYNTGETNGSVIGADGNNLVIHVGPGAFDWLPTERSASSN